MRSVVITGADGQLGRCFREIRAERAEVPYEFRNSKEWDITAPEAYEKIDPVRVAGVVNCAAYTLVDAAEKHRNAAYKVNVTGAELMARWCDRYGIPLIHISTDYVYGAGDGIPLKEDHPADPLNWYGRTKWEGEKRIRKYLKSHIILRTSWLYAHHGHNFVRTMLRFGKERENIRVVDDQRGSPTYAADLAAAVDFILRRYLSEGEFHAGTYNFCNRGETTWFGLARKVLEATGQGDKVKPVPASEYPTEAVRPEYSVLDTEKFRETFDYSVPHWEEALKRCLRRIEEKEAESGTGENNF